MEYIIITIGVYILLYICYNAKKESFLNKIFQAHIHIPALFVGTPFFFCGNFAILDSYFNHNIFNKSFSSNTGIFIYFFILYVPLLLIGFSIANKETHNDKNKKSSQNTYKESNTNYNKSSNNNNYTYKKPENNSNHNTTNKENSNYNQSTTNNHTKSGTTNNHNKSDTTNKPVYDKIKKSFSILELDENSNCSQIKERWRTLMLIYHPDKNTSNKLASDFSLKKSEEVNNAYQILKEHFHC